MAPCGVSGSSLPNQAMICAGDRPERSSSRSAATCRREGRGPVGQVAPGGVGFVPREAFGDGVGHRPQRDLARQRIGGLIEDGAQPAGVAGLGGRERSADRWGVVGDRPVDARHRQSRRSSPGRSPGRRRSRRCQPPAMFRENRARRSPHASCRTHGRQGRGGGARGCRTRHAKSYCPRLSTKSATTCGRITVF